MNNNGLLLSETTGNETLRYYYDSTGKVVSIGYQKGTAAEVLYFFARNGQGDVIAIYRNSDSKLIGTYEYDLWGRLISVKEASSGIDTNGILAKNPIRYRGYYYDSETGFYYLQSRYYDPGVRRFISADRYISTGQGLTGHNMFAYCGNNPVNRMDPEGKAWVQIVVAILVVGATMTLIGCVPATTPAVPVYTDAPEDYVQENSTQQNCYSYAFGLPNAANPGDFSISESDSIRMYEDKGVYTVQEVADYVMRDMQAIGRSVRIVDSPLDKKRNEYIVAMKTSNIEIPPYGIADYHFAVQLSDGTWADKQGSDPSRWNAIDGTASMWDINRYNRNYYNTETIYFAVEREL